MKVIISNIKGLCLLFVFLINLSVANAQVLFDNGPLVNSPGSGVGGADESVLQNLTLGLNLIGFGHQIAFSNSIADDFKIPTGKWNISTITLYAYQTGSTTASTLNDVRVRIWDGTPGQPGSNIVFGDLTTNRLASSTWSGIYRVLETTIGSNTQRPIMANLININTILSAGTYWVEWQTGGSSSFTGPWAPPVSIQGQASTGNALQSVDGGVTYNLANDFSGDQQGLPFIIEGIQIAAVPTLGEWGLIIFYLLIISIAMVFLMAPKMATTTGQTIPAKAILQNFAFDKNTFFKTWVGVALATVLGFVTAMNVFGYELTNADPIGAFIASGIVAYLITKMKK